MTDNPWGDEDARAAQIADSIYCGDWDRIPDLELLMETCSAFEAWAYDFRRTNKQPCFSELLSIELAASEVGRDQR